MIIMILLNNHLGGFIMKKFSFVILFLIISSILYATPKAYLFNEKVNFISSKKIEISGDMMFTNLLTKNQCMARFHNDIIEANIYFEYVVDGGNFKEVFVSKQFPTYYKYQYLYSNGISSNTPINTNTPGGPGDYIYSVTDTNRGSYLLEEPYYNEDCQYVTSYDDGKIFHFHKIFNIPDASPAPNSQYRLFIELEDMMSSNNNGTVIYFVRDFYGPYNVPTQYTASGIATYNSSKSTIHIPFLDMSNISKNTVKTSTTAWLDLKVESRNSALAFILDTKKNKGGFGINQNISISDNSLLAKINTQTLILTIPQFTLDDKNFYWLKLKFTGSTGSEIAFNLDSYGKVKQDYSGAVALPCENDAVFVRSLYQSILGRDLEISTQAGHGGSHLESLRNGASRKDLIKAFFRSREYTNYNKTDAEFIRDAYQAVLSREPSDSEKNLTVNDRMTFLDNLFSSTEYINLIASCEDNSTNTQYKILQLNSASNYSYSFVNDNMTSRPNFDANYDLMLEPWCVSKVPMCGNFAKTNATSLSDLIKVPSSGYLSDSSGFGDCTEIEPNTVYVNKNRDNSYTAFIVTSHAKPSDCQHTVTIQYKNIEF